MSKLRNRNIVVTGGAGFIGSHLVNRLVRDGAKVTVLDNLTTGKRGNVGPGADFIEIDLGDKDQYKKIAGVKADTCFHLAAQSSGEASFLDPDYDLKSHVNATFHLLDWCKKNNTKRFLYASSMSVYGDAKDLPVKEDAPLNPKTFYGAGKASAENYVRLYQSHGLDTTIFRLFSIYGPGQNFDNKLQGMVSIYLSYLLEKKPITVKGSKDRFRDFVYIDDLIDAWMEALDDPFSFGKTYNVATGRKITVENVIDELKKAFNEPKHPVLYGDGTPGDQFGVTGDNSRIQKELSWTPKTDFKSGLKVMVEKARKDG